MRAYCAGAVPRAAGAGGPADELGRAEAAAGAVPVGRGLPVRRRRGRGEGR
jgi:hypothetical protein